MENKEAITELREFWDWFCWTYPESEYANVRVNYAFDMAFDALSQCGDVDPYLVEARKEAKSDDRDRV